MSEPSHRSEELGSPLQAVPGLARIAAYTGYRTAGWAVGTTARIYGRTVRAAMGGESAAEVFNATGEEIRSYGRRLLGVIDPEDRTAPVTQRFRRSEEPENKDLLRERGAELLEQSSDVHFDEAAHPAYLGILEQLAPDEGRILRLLATHGAQPSVDIRNGWPIVSNLVAPGRNMIGAHAGCRHTDRVPSYLNNLFRLGLVWFSRERIDDPSVYQVLEAQPDVIEALEKAGRSGRTIRRSILLTPFGQDFCRTCLPMDTAELEALPAQPRPVPDTVGDPATEEAEPAAAPGPAADTAG